MTVPRAKPTKAYLSGLEAIIARLQRKPDRLKLVARSKGRGRGKRLKAVSR